MTVSYDGAGDPVFIKVNGKPYEDKSDSATTSSASKSYSDSAKANSTLNSYYAGTYCPYDGFYAEGGFSWYKDIHGQRNHILRDGYCATDETYDNCNCGTRLDAYAPNNNEKYLTKWDVGNLSPHGRILDLRPDDFRSFGYSTNIGVIYNGEYFHTNY